MTAAAWGSILLVAVVSIVVACSVVAIYASGLRLWSTADTMAGRYSVAADGSVAPADTSSPRHGTTTGVRLVRLAAIGCFTLSGVVVLWGIFLLIPHA
ncbi:hypothetical protein [Curtobacterium ammoniigenes]|uniref:hypothetical protein n=1 Tax=Curtobacterium ammoniigenes TaxID=395387 RepID=UPI000833C77B|nr:hypothetical protein [Curtobacterium ammoniigenes]